MQDSKLTDRELFKKEVQKCILFKDEDRDFWLNEADTVPAIVIKNLLSRLVAANKKIDGFIDKALKEDKEKVYLTKIKNIVKEAKNKMAGEQESTEKEAAEEDLMESLAELDNQ